MNASKALSIALVSAAIAIATPQAMAGETVEKITETSGSDKTEAASSADVAQSEQAMDAAGGEEIAEASDFDAAEGEKLYKKECRACHGPTAKGVSSYPKLVDQPFDYLVDRLERYRAGEKFGPNTMLMAPRAKKLSDDDIGNLAAFITSIELPENK